MDSAKIAYHVLLCTQTNVTEYFNVHHVSPGTAMLFSAVLRILKVEFILTLVVHCITNLIVLLSISIILYTCSSFNSDMI